MHFEVPVHLGGLDPASVRIELFAEGKNGAGPVRKEMDRGVPLADDIFLYVASVEGNRPAIDFTPRALPYHPSASVPLEAHEIIWQK